MAHEEPKIRIETREELIYLLAEAAAIEHNLMCCYLYAAWSLKRGERDGLTPAQATAVARWKHAILSVAVEEMTHLALASNLATSIGGSPHFSRPNFPIPPGYHPSGVVVELAGFSPAVLDHFIFLERPPHDRIVRHREGRREQRVRREELAVFAPHRLEAVVVAVLAVAGRALALLDDCFDGVFGALQVGDDRHSR